MSKIKRQAFLSRTQAATRMRRNRARRGQTLVEYALIISIISIVAIGVLINLGKNLGALYSTIDSQVQRAPGGVNSTGI